MTKDRAEIEQDVLFLLNRLADDWEFGGIISTDTYLISDLGFGSLDVVVFSASVQEHYRQVLPFADLFTEIGQREKRDITVGEWVDFIHSHLNSTGSPATGTGS